MEIIDLNTNIGISLRPKAKKELESLKNLIQLLKQKNLKPETIRSINQIIESKNRSIQLLHPKKKYAALKEAKMSIFKLVEKEEQLTAKNHFQNQWIALGMTVFGLPMGVAMAISLNNWSFVGIGLPIGLAIGAGYGSQLDKKALEENRQLDIEI